MIPVLSPAQCAEWDARAEAGGVALATLMECAGRAAAQVLAARHPDAVRGGVLVAAGTGNNGGDGWVVARALARAGARVWVASLPGPRSPLCEAVAARALGEGVREVAADGPWPGVALAVDAILGTGASGAPRPPAAALLGRIHDLDVPVVAIDGPTGVDLGTGMSHAPSRADLTITFGGLRRGHLLAREDMGDVVVVDIGHPPADPAWPLLVAERDAAAWLPRLRVDFHKGDRGRVVVVGGDAGMTGALRLAARSAFAAGAGLVHAVAPPATVAALVTAEPDLQTLAQPFDVLPGEGLRALLGRADVVAVGPGLGRAEGRRAFVEAVLSDAAAAVLDADALVAFQGATASLAAVAARSPLVLTPHPGEFRALFPDLAAQVETDPWGAAVAAAERAGATVLLKGVPTVVAASGQPPLTVAAGNPGLATGGSGDLLTGIIAALMGQGLAARPAAATGAVLLGVAADLAAQDATARGLRPMDVLAALARVWPRWVDLVADAPARPPVLLDLPRPATT